MKVKKKSNERNIIRKNKLKGEIQFLVFITENCEYYLFVKFSFFENVREFNLCNNFMVYFSFVDPLWDSPV